MTLNTAIRGAQIEDLSISGAHLVSTNSPSDGQVLTWNSTQSQFEWDDLGSLITGEAPTGDINGANTTFTTANTPVSSTEMVYLNGLLQEPGALNDYTISGSTISFLTAPETGDIVLVSYLTSQGLGGGGADHGSLTGLADDDHPQYLKNVSEDTTPQLGGDLDLNQYYLQLDPTPTSDDTGNGFMSSVTVDTNSVGVGAGLYMASDGHYDMADASASGTMPCEAVALETGTGTKKVLKYGYIRNDGWDWTPGGLVYVSTTAGQLTQSAPSGSGEQVQIVGYATSADVLFFNPNYTMVEIS